MSCDTHPFTPPHHSPQSPSPNPTSNEPACVILTLLDIFIFINSHSGKKKLGDGVAKILEGLRWQNSFRKVGW